MTFFFNASGANSPLIKEFDIASDTSVASGHVVGVKDGLIVNTGSHDAIIGVAAEDHPGTADLLNPRANGTKVRVNCASHAVYRVPAQKLTVTAPGSTTVFKTSSAALSVDLTKGKVVLIKKGGGSTNEDSIGTVRTFSAVTISGNDATFTVSSGGTPCAGDVYALLPPVGSEVALNSTGDGAVYYSGSTTVKFIVACTDEESRTWGVMLKNGYLK